MTLVTPDRVNPPGEKTPCLCKRNLVTSYKNSPGGFTHGNKGYLRSIGYGNIVSGRKRLCGRLFKNGFWLAGIVLVVMCVAKLCYVVKIAHVTSIC